MYHIGGGAYPKKKLKKGRTPVNIIVNITLYNVKGSVRADQERVHRPFRVLRVTLCVLRVTLLCTESHPFFGKRVAQSHPFEGRKGASLAPFARRRNDV